MAYEPRDHRETLGDMINIRSSLIREKTLHGELLAWSLSLPEAHELTRPDSTRSNRALTSDKSGDMDLIVRDRPFSADRRGATVGII